MDPAMLRYALLSLWSLAVGHLHVQAADLAKVDRSLAKEPAYKTKTPRYCLLVFGPEAK